jgi:hypothetical protein
VKCLFCGKEFEAERKTARFDSSTCRSAYFRKPIKTPEQAQEKVSVAKEIVSVASESEIKDSQPVSVASKFPGFNPPMRVSGIWTTKMVWGNGIPFEPKI